ncbi:hypothetical protein [uncultured Tenacibaculum sp.]|uniref:hypothetical protein n=1 Tax=uncultured Tenacibaculum sp. TaxID=174713 RepID=UPI00261190AB|nr:hypothetical protein [uncultured Tenacibaculum sp.]
MKKVYQIITIGLLSLLCISASKLNTDPIDFLSVGKNIEFNKESFELKWSSHPSENYYKQEYLRKDDKFPKFKKMIMVEAIEGEISGNQAAEVKIMELENWKKKNPIVKYQKIENKEKNEVLLDFILTDGKSIYEWNIYRYQNQKSKSGNYLVLYSYSHRGYITNKEEEAKFFDSVKEIKADLINKVNAISLPNVKTK